jgi:hypothetical protein
VEGADTMRYSNPVALCPPPRYLGPDAAWIADREARIAALKRRHARNEGSRRRKKKPPRRRTMRPVICLDTMQVFRSSSAASKAAGVHRLCIYNSLRHGKRGYTICRGRLYLWWKPPYTKRTTTQPTAASNTKETP